MLSALRDRESRIRRLVDSNIIGILIADLDEGWIIDANDAFLDLVGYEREDLVSRQMRRSDMTPAEWRGVTERAVAQLKATMTCEPYEKEYIRKDGSRVPVLVGAAAFEESRNECVAFVLDLTERKRAEEKYQLLMEQAHDAILVPDPSGVVLEANRKTEILMGRRRDEIVGHALVSVMEPAGAVALDALLATGSARLRQLRLSRTDGKVLDIEVSAAPVSIAGQDAVMLIARDVTQRLLPEDQLRQSQKMEAIGQLTGGIAHDFNNILTVITGTIEILIDEFADKPNFAAIAKMIDEAGTRGADLTRQLLAFARKQALQPRDTDINALITDAAWLWRPTLGEAIEIKLTLEDGCWHGMIDPSQLSTALLNLAVNARDAMPNGGKLTFGSANVILDETYAEANAKRRPGVPVLFTSGYPENAIIHHGRLDSGVALLNKPYRKPDLARMIRQILATRAAPRRVDGSQSIFWPNPEAVGGRCPTSETDA